MITLIPPSAQEKKDAAPRRVDTTGYPKPSYEDEDDFYIADEQVPQGKNDSIDPKMIEYHAIIKVFGVGGGGNNSVTIMAETGPDNIEYYAINTDAAMLRKLNRGIMHRIQIGKETTGGRGAGGEPQVGADSAKESEETLREGIKGANLVFISAGMGGGTGTGAAPVIARLAHEQNILVIGVVTKPFNFEGGEKMKLALQGIDEMRANVDSLVIIPNEKLVDIKKAMTYSEAMRIADEVLANSVLSIASIVFKTSDRNVDFADVEKMLRGSGLTHIATGKSKGEKRADDVYKQIVDSQILETSVANAGRLIIDITAPQDMGFREYQDLVARITGLARSDVKMKDGMGIQADGSDILEVTVVATDFKTGALSEQEQIERIDENIRRAEEENQNKPLRAREPFVPTESVRAAVSLDIDDKPLRQQYTDNPIFPSFVQPEIKTTPSNALVDALNHSTKPIDEEAESFLPIKNLLNKPKR
ncbi:MAG: cell division protein FtsZ [Oscillospiraceae bacterium]|jgi:cell division protein FtsZ|nr:cell division protein FtsZ [Oscillospiraceae bacterium]